MKLKQLFEALFEFNTDVDYIYNIAFKKFIDDVDSGKKPHEYEIMEGRDVELKRLSSSDLKSSDCMRSDLANSIEIVCGVFRSGNYYNPRARKIQLSLNLSAVQYKYNPSIFDLTSSQTLTIVNEVTENRIKSSISHELSHWVDDTSHNYFLGKLLSRANEFNNSEILKLKKHDVNMTYFEIQGQIHGIASLKRTYKGNWDELTLADLFSLYTSLSSINNNLNTRYGNDISKIWQKYLVKRMNREGLLGKNMKNFVK